MQATTWTHMKLMAGTLALSLGLSLGLAGAAAAQPGPGPDGGGHFGPGGKGSGGPGGPGGPGGRMGGPLGGLLGLHPDLPLAALNLTDAQREQVRTIMQGHREEGQALMQKGQSAIEALRKATEGTVDEGAAGQQGQAVGAVIAEAAVLRAKVRGEILAILTPEQQAEASKIQAEREARMKQFRQKMEQRRKSGPARTPEDF
jgi:Spy/CpxP family protein refolding chaperone